MCYIPVCFDCAWPCSVPVCICVTFQREIWRSFTPPADVGVAPRGRKGRSFMLSVPRRTEATLHQSSFMLSVPGHTEATLHHSSFMLSVPGHTEATLHHSSFMLSVPRRTEATLHHSCCHSRVLQTQSESWRWRPEALGRLSGRNA